jgi:hypothetical protein
MVSCHIPGANRLVDESLDLWAHVRRYIDGLEHVLFPCISSARLTLYSGSVIVMVKTS